MAERQANGNTRGRHTRGRKEAEPGRPAGPPAWDSTPVVYHGSPMQAENGEG